MISKNLQDYAQAYTGYDRRAVGPGLINPNIYASDKYALRKTSNILMGSINDFIYAGAEHDRSPLALVWKYEPQYNTILAYNLHYFPIHYRQAILKFVLDSNAARIKNNQPMYIDYDRIKRYIPPSVGGVRRYKIVLINVYGTVPLAQWPAAIKDKSKWTQMYKKGYSPD